MTLNIEMLTLGVAQTNCYIIADRATGDAAIIDPVADAPTILMVAHKAGWKIREILITHAHFDHVMALTDVKAATGATIRMHAADLPLLAELPLWAKALAGQQVPPAPPPDVLINEGDTVTLGETTLEIRFTPGHAPGHVSYISHADAVVFSGDCLFAGSIGRYDLPGGNKEILFKSIFSKLLTLPDDYTVAAGHMQTTTIGKERASNPYLLDYMGIGDDESL